MNRSMSILRRFFSRLNTSTSKSTRTSRQIQSTAIQVNTSTYTIKSGDTLAKIASQSGSSVSALQQANPDINTSNMKVGLVIRLARAPLGALQPVQAVPGSLNSLPNPNPSVPVSVAISGSIYTIQAGDNYATIAARLGSSVVVIEAANPGVNPKTLQVGSFINVPPSSNPVLVLSPTPPVTVLGRYTILSGDTYEGVAVKLGTTFGGLSDVNPGMNSNALLVGSQINITATTIPSPGPVTPPPNLAQAATCASSTYSTAYPTPA